MRLNILVCVLLLFCASFAHAQALSLTYDAPNQAAYPDNTLTFSGTLLNNSTSPLYLNGATYTLSSGDLSLDSLDFITNAPASLLPNQSWSGDLFTVYIASNAQLGVTQDTFTITGGYGVNDQNDLVTTPFTVAVTPAPSSLIVPIMGFIPGVIMLTRRHHRQKA